MQTLTRLIMVVSVLFLATACSSADEPAAESTSDGGCTATFSEIMADAQIMGVTEAELQTDEDAPIAGGVDGEAIVLNEESLTMARYEADGTDDEIVTLELLQEDFGAEAEIVEDSPAAFGQKSFTINFNDEDGMEGILAQYGDRLLLAKNLKGSDSVRIQEEFEMVLADFVKDNPACASLQGNQ